MAADWMKRGYDAGNEEAEAQKSRRRGGVQRFWLPQDKSATVVFLDGEDPPVYREHNVQIDGSWKNWFTCIQGMKDSKGQTMRCPACRAGNKPYMAVAYTVVDRTEWKDKNGNQHKDEVKLLVVKDGVFPLLEKMNTKRKGLTGCVVEVTRSKKENSASTGDIWDYEDKMPAADLKAEFPEAATLDYEKLLAPRTYDELVDIFGSEPAPKGSRKSAPKSGGAKRGKSSDEDDDTSTNEDGGGSESQEEDIPF